MSRETPEVAQLKHDLARALHISAQECAARVKAETALASARRDALEEAAKALPHTWLDPIINESLGRQQQQGGYSGQQIERFLLAITERIRTLKSKPSPASGEQINADAQGGSERKEAERQYESCLPAQSAPNAAGLAAAVPDDPVALFAKLAGISGVPRHFEPPADSIPVWACCICGAHKPVEQERKP